MSGEQGSAKTILSKLLRALVDPNVAPVRALPRDERELMIAANNGHLLAFDNLSGLPAWLSDALCRVASGGSFAVRQLYTDDEEVLFKATRPTLLNGIEDVIRRSDLADRAIFLTLEPIREEQRRSETELWREFELARPGILGAFLDAAVEGLRAVDSIHLARLPRMADFALWAAACETALWPAGTFSRAYAANREAAIESMIDADPIAACVRELMSEHNSWTGSAADLLRVSAQRRTEHIFGSGNAWPKSPRALAGHLRRAQTFLRTAPSVASAAMGPTPAQNAGPRVARPFCEDSPRGRLRTNPEGAQKPQTMLTVLTQRSASLCGQVTILWSNLFMGLVAHRVQRGLKVNFVPSHFTTASHDCFQAGTT